VFYNGPPFDVSVVGSCMLARFRGENFLIATRHQLGKGDEQRPETEVCVALFDDAKSRIPTLLTPSGGIRISFNDADDKFLEDILVLTFEREKHKLAQLNVQFLQLDEMKCLDEVDPRRIIQYLTIAFPSIGNRPELKSDGMGFEGFESGFVRLALEPTGDASLDRHIAFRVKEGVRKERDFDGYSGAPVYFIFADDTGQAHVGWVGMIRLGGNGILHVYLASQIRRGILTTRKSHSADEGSASDGSKEREDEPILPVTPS
jgi:hypothetical protein